MQVKGPENTPSVARKIGVYGIAPIAAGLAIYAVIGIPGLDHKSGSGSTQTEVTPPSSVPSSPPTRTEAPTPFSSSIVPTPVVTPLVTTSSLQASPEAGGSSGCAAYQGQEAELCTSYVVLTADVALQGMYKFGNNSLSLPASTARNAFENRYFGQARQTIEQEVSSWPETSRLFGNKVQDTVRPVSVEINATAQRGLLQTEESWRVIAPDGTILHDEPTHPKAVTLCLGKLPNIPVKEWLVVSETLEPNFDCLGFERANGIEP